MITLKAQQSLADSVQQVEKLRDRVTVLETDKSSLEKVLVETKKEVKVAKEGKQVITFVRTSSLNDIPMNEVLSLVIFQRKRTLG